MIKCSESYLDARTHRVEARNAVKRLCCQESDRRMVVQPTNQVLALEAECLRMKRSRGGTEWPRESKNKKMKNSRRRKMQLRHWGFSGGHFIY